MRLASMSRKITRDLVVFMVGLLGVIHETVVKDAERPTLLILFGAALGLPVFLRRDEAQSSETKAAADHTEVTTGDGGGE